ncbi:sugar phosphate isomerase/epimerase family protein [Bacillus sp. N9]
MAVGEQGHSVLEKQVELLEQYNVRAAIEPHPGFVVYNTETILRLRKECGERIGANFDPSHYFWRGMDPVNSIKALGDSLLQIARTEWSCFDNRLSKSRSR